MVGEERLIDLQRRMGLSKFRIEPVPTKGVGYGRVDLEVPGLMQELDLLKCLPLH